MVADFGYYNKLYSKQYIYVWDLLILIDITCGKVDLQNLEEILNILSETVLIRLVEKGYLDFSNTYRSNIKYSDYRYILFKLYNK